MRINSSGELLMNGLYGGYDSNATGAITLNANASDGTVNFKKGIVFSSDGGSAQSLWAHAGITSTGSAGFNGNLIFGTDGTGTQSSTITERMRIDSNGRIQVSGTAIVDVARVTVSFDSANSTGIGIKHTSGGGTLMVYANSAGTVVGSITSNGTNVAYNTSSDYRLKENVAPMSGSIDRLKQLKPSTWSWKIDGSHGEGFLAHEAQAVVPEAVHGAKDAMRTEGYEVTSAVLDDDGNVVTEAVMGTREVPDYQGIDQSKLVPLLTAALQEAIQRIETLTTRIEALEAK